MNINAFIGLLLVMFACSGNEQKLRSGLLIENKINRGINYTDALGVDYSLRYIPVTITNDSTLAIHLTIAFSNDYNYPHTYSEEKFRLVPLPMEWALDGVGITESLINELPSYMDNPVMNKTIEPGEKIVFGIGSIYPRPANTTGVLPRILFTQNDTIAFPECNWLMERDQASNQQISLGLKIIFGEKCVIIPSGKISFGKLE